MITNADLERLQAQIYAENGVRTDIYFVEGRGALVVREGDALIPQNIIAAIPEFPFGFGGIAI